MKGPWPNGPLTVWEPAGSSSGDAAILPATDKVDKDARGGLAVARACPREQIWPLDLPAHNSKLVPQQKQLGFRVAYSQLYVDDVEKQSKAGLERREQHWDRDPSCLRKLPRVATRWRISVAHPRGQRRPGAVSRHEWGPDRGYKSSPGDNSHVDSYEPGAMIVTTPVDSKGASRMGSPGSLLFAVRPRIQVLDAPGDQETTPSPSCVSETRITWASSDARAKVRAIIREQWKTILTPRKSRK